jgi:hypothetical protein
VTLPGFLVIGAGRSGTTSLHHHLGAHPEVFVPTVKSPSHFYCRDRPVPRDRTRRAEVRQHFVADPADYERLFDRAGDAKAVGEVSPVYLAATDVAPRIAARLPEVRLIALLRHPAERVHARFVGRRRDGLERRTDLARVVRDERRTPLLRDDAAGTYLAAGFCGRFLATYFERFPRQRIRIHLFEDLRRDPRAVLRDLYEFLGVDPSFAPDLARRHNASGGTIGNPAARWLWTRSAPLRLRLRPHLPATLRGRVFARFTRRLEPVPLAPELRAELTELYRDDILRLGGLIGRDLGHWLAVPDGSAS